jgi:hypothetical protein
MSGRRRFIAAVTAAIVIAGGMLIGAPARAATVPNMYHCSNYTLNCWQTNPPHVASIINKCYWYNDYVYNAAWWANTCNKYTPR